MTHPAITFDMVAQWPSSTIKLTEQQAQQLGIDTSAEEIRGELKTRGPFQTAVSYRALCVSGKLGTPEGFHSEFFTEKTVYGMRTMSDLKESGHAMDGRVSINGRRYSAFTSSQLFEVNGRLINVAVIHARVR